uniref:Peptidase M14 domain-containing protein n=1 Tax=Arion vulgaris TaxID=1028688 RepID=A0A0B6ZD93_9EUPU
MTAETKSFRQVRSNDRTLTKSSVTELLVVLLKSMLLLSHVCTARPDREDDSHKYKVLRLHFKIDDDINIIRQLKVTHNLDPWQEVRRVNSTGDYLVSPQNVDEVEKQLKNNHIHYNILIDDAERFVKENDPMRFRRRKKRSTSAHDYRNKFLTYTELRHFLRDVKNTATNANVEMESIGRSFEGRPTPYVKISSLNDKKPKGTIFIDGGIHGREWISPALTVEIIHRLAFNTENDTAVDTLLSMFNWLIVPLVNPDGYAHTFTPGLENRMWRKSRSTSYSNDPNCFGVDLNRNFGYHWNNSPSHGGSSNPCSGTFSGPRSFSEPESHNLRNILLGNNDTIKGYLSFHSFGQFFLYPWGYSSDVDIEDEDDLVHVAAAFSKAMMAKNYDYNVGGSAKVLYPAAGGSDDYVRGTVGVKYSYTVELPPHETSRYGFLLPESLVSSVVSDTWDGLKAFALRLYKHLNTKGERQDVLKDEGQAVREANNQKLVEFKPTNVHNFNNGPGNANVHNLNNRPGHGNVHNFNNRPGHANGNSYTTSIGSNRDNINSTAYKIKRPKLEPMPVSYLVESIWTSRPLWLSRPRNPTYSRVETSISDVINTLFKTRKIMVG